VFRNRLMELIQYAPTTATVYHRPVVLIQPWINKYYIFDLQASNSFVRFLIDRGFSVFITSWKNPTADMRAIGFEDYVRDGVLTAIEVARRICNVDRVHAAGYCIGGTALAASMAWLHAGKDASASFPVADWTLFTTLVDFSDPGDLGVFISPESIAFIHALMEPNGYLDGKYVGLVFRLLKADHLIWGAFARTCLQGQAPLDSDVLYWNGDATHLPRAAASFLLEALYLKNRLVEPNGVKLAGRTLDLRRVDEPLYLVGALQDHICPWTGTFATCRRVQSPARYVLANEGHIAGIVNPPSARSKKKYWAGSVSTATDPEQWLASQSVRQGSWWTDWADWLPKRGDSQVAPPAMGCDAHPAIEPAPGRYVKE
jgi:polyhydroxyalkanoate synthase subunit PhaC